MMRTVRVLAKNPAHLVELKKRYQPIRDERKIQIEFVMDPVSYFLYRIEREDRVAKGWCCDLDQDRLVLPNHL